MNERDRLQTDLHHDPAIPHGPKYDRCYPIADRLIALGWTRRDLPPDWCGHDAEIAHLNGVILRQHDCDHSDCIDREERLRKIEEAARALYFDGGMDVFTDSAQEAANALRAALEAKR